MDGESGVLGAPRALSGPGRIRAHALAGAGLALVAMGVVLADPVAALVAKALVDPFFHSTSAGAAVALLGLIAFGLFSLALARGLPSLRVVHAAVWLLLTSAVLGNAANLVAHLWLLADHDLPWSQAVYYWAGDTNTYSYVLHAHTGKAALSALLSGWAAPLTSSFDIGTGLAAQVPTVLGVVCLVSLVIAVAACAWLLPVVVSRWPGWPMPLLYAFCALNAVKTIADGGPLTYRFAPVLAVLLLILPAGLRMGRRVQRAAIIAAVVAVAASVVVSIALAGLQTDEALEGLATTSAVIGALAAWAWRPVTASRRWLRSGVALSCALAVLGSLIASLIATPVVLLAPLPQDTYATLCERVGGECEQHLVEGQRAFDVYRHAGDDPLKPRRTMLSTGRELGLSRLMFAIHPLKTQRPTLLRATAVSVRPMAALSGAAGVLVEAEARSLPVIFGGRPGPFSTANYYVFLHQVAAVLRAQGLDEFIMAPLRSEADARALGLSVAAVRRP